MAEGRISGLPRAVWSQLWRILIRSARGFSSSTRPGGAQARHASQDPRRERRPRGGGPRGGAGLMGFDQKVARARRRSRRLPHDHVRQRDRVPRLQAPRAGPRGDVLLRHAPSRLGTWFEREHQRVDSSVRPERHQNGEPLPAGLRRNRSRTQHTKAPQLPNTRGVL